MDKMLQQTAHSAEVELALHINGRTVSLAKVGPERLTLETAIDLPPCDAEVAIHIDGHEYRRPIHLPQGASSSSPFVVINSRN